MALRSAIINVMVGAAEKAARSLVHDFGEVEQLQVSKKGPADFVSNADLQAERIIKEELSKARPQYSFLMEESGVTGSAEAEGRWIVDPLDGTSNFLHGIPQWCISIALEFEKEIVAGVVYDPVKNEMFAAERGQGAYMNARRLRVSGRDKLDDAMIATGIPFGNRTGKSIYLSQLDRFMQRGIAIRRQGSAALDMAYVAAGRYEAFWELQLYPWDVAAGCLLVTEAGGFASEVGGGPNAVHGGSILAANSQLHAELIELLAVKEPIT
jgi:myo-inositol-1(or 4)-monophosphatase